NSGRWLQWHWPGETAPGQARADTWILANVFLRVKALYQTEGGAFPDPILNLSWDYKDAYEPSAEELAKEMNGRALADLYDPADATKLLVKAGDQLPNFAVMRDDGTTMSGCWIYAGSWTQDGNMMARRD